MNRIKTFFSTIYKLYPGFLLPLLLSLFVLLGNSYHQYGSWEQCFGSLGKFALFLLLLCISFVAIKIVLGLCFKFLDYLSQSSTGNYPRFFQQHVILRCMALLVICWIPYLLAAFPGNLCIDSQTQLNQIYGYAPYSTHHPMLHTFLMGVLVKGGEAFLGSANLGLFLYIGLQTLFLAFALSLSIWAMCYKKVSRLWVYLALGFYCITPLFGYYASLAIKDTPFNAAFLVFLIAFILLWEKAPLKSMPFLLCISAVLVCQLRNNGIYLIGFVCIVLALVLTKKKTWKNYFSKLFAPIFVAILAHMLINFSITAIFNPLQGYSREMLSIFMQQTARYTVEYGQDMTPAEQEVLTEIFGDLSMLAGSYNPHLSDPVKNLFKMDASTEEILQYLKVWFTQFWRHPDAYFESFFHGAYGWFYPFVDNASKYYDPGFIFTKPQICVQIDQLVSWWYDAFRQIPVLNLLQSIGFFTWLMFISVAYLWKRGNKQQLLYFAPVLLSLLICIAAPAFFQHARYGFPILFCMPMLIGILIAPKK